MNVPSEMYFGGHFEKLKFVSLKCTFLYVKPTGLGVGGGGGGGPAGHKAGI